MACWACGYGDDCCEGVWASAKEHLANGRKDLAMLQSFRMCARCVIRFAETLGKVER